MVVTFAFSKWPNDNHVDYSLTDQAIDEDHGLDNLYRSRVDNLVRHGRPLYDYWSQQLGGQNSP